MVNENDESPWNYSLSLLTIIEGLVFIAGNGFGGNLGLYSSWIAVPATVSYAESVSLVHVI
jgi:hypothetical protein